MTSVLVPLADGCEEIEAVTIIDLLRRADIEVVTAGLKPGPVTASRGMVLVPDTTLDGLDGNDFDMIVLPGGKAGAENLRDDAKVQALIRDMAAKGKYTCAICAAPIALANAGVLSGKRATSFPGFLEGLNLPGVTVTEAPVETDGKVITSRGPGTAMDFGLTLIETLKGTDARNEVEVRLMRPQPC
jgi:protein deglycase